MASGIKDKVAILGMGCTKFGERWDMSGEDLIIEAFQECLADAGIEKKEIQAAWLAVCADAINIGHSSIPLSVTLKLPNIAVSRVENMCVSGTDALRGAAYAVASGAYDICLALGVEKLKDVGFGGLPVTGSKSGQLNWMWFPDMTNIVSFAMLGSAYTAKYGISDKDLKSAMAHVSAKSHANGALNPKAHLQNAISVDTIMAAPMIAPPLGLFDCCGVSDGAACAIVTTPEIAKQMGKKDLVTIKAMQMGVSNGYEARMDGWGGDYILTTAKVSAEAYKEAGVKSPREEINMMEVHDCFSITELITMEDLHISERGQAPKDVMDGFYNLDGKIPCQPDGGLKCFGHPIAASGLRMVYEMYLQLRGRADKRQINNPKLGLTHNLGGYPFHNVCAVSILGKEGI
jgi:acetyl-CoA C-acetyltransferase